MRTLLKMKDLKCNMFNIIPPDIQCNTIVSNKMHINFPNQPIIKQK